MMTRRGFLRWVWRLGLAGAVYALAIEPALRLRVVTHRI